MNLEKRLLQAKKELNGVRNTLDQINFDLSYRSIPNVPTSHLKEIMNNIDRAISDLQRSGS